VTILFADMCAFTSMSEKMEPEDVVQTLNQYLGLMSKIVFEHGGTVDKYMGDCVMAFFNAPRSQDDHAAQAVRAALAIHEQTAKLGDDKLPAIDMSIGINTGEAVIGNIGGEHRLDYTAIGDSINVGARLCSAAGTAETLITSSTHKFVKDSFKCRKLGPEKFKGKKEPVVVYAVEGGETPEQSPQAD
ncbi:MAG: adenylate/guanylate cyclase domain-containing protein, partial [Terriglobia bacterium]